VALGGWIVDKSAVARAHQPPYSAQLTALAGSLFICPVGALEQLYSARSARHYDQLKAELPSVFETLRAPEDILDRALRLQQDLAHHHGMWHRVAIPDLLIAETALHHDVGVVHVDGDYERIAKVRPLRVLRLTETA
jgi:predicted nucleic acid-binding protein